MKDVFGDASEVLDASVLPLLRDLAGTDNVQSMEGSMDHGLWKSLEQAGMTCIGVAEEAGGSGGDLTMALAVVTAAANFGAPLPLAESMVIVPWLKARCGWSWSPQTSVLVRVDSPENDAGVHRSLMAVPWAQAVEEFVVLHRVGSQLLATAIPVSSASVEPAPSIAGEPHGYVRVAASVLREAHGYPVSDETQQILSYLEGLTRAAMMWGAMRAVLEQTVSHVTTREQFGGPIARFQAVKHAIAELASEVEICGAALSGALAGSPESLDPLHVAAARVRCGQGAEVVSRIGHQLHGAMGYTRENPLHLFTRRLWSWRDEYGTDAWWLRRLGELVTAEAHAGIFRLLSREAVSFNEA